MTTRHAIASACLLAVLVACNQDVAAPEAGTPSAEPAAPAPTETAETAAPSTETRSADAAAPVDGPAPPSARATAGADGPAFAGTVWRVTGSGGVAVGTTYAFLADGTLVIESPGGNPPGYGKWRYEGGKLTIEEDAIAYPTDIVRSDADQLTLRSHNPGGTLDIELERVPGAALPEVP